MARALDVLLYGLEAVEEMFGGHGFEVYGLTV